MKKGRFKKKHIILLSFIIAEIVAIAIILLTVDIEDIKDALPIFGDNDNQVDDSGDGQYQYDWNDSNESSSSSSSGGSSSSSSSSGSSGGGEYSRERSIYFGPNDLIWFVTDQEFFIGDNSIYSRNNETSFTPGGLDGLDKICNSLGARFRREFKAIISDSYTNARDRIPTQGMIVNVKAENITGVGELFPLPNFNELGLYVNLDQYGDEQLPPLTSGGFWWGSDINGVKLGESSLDQCNDWMSNKESGRQIDITNPSFPIRRYGCDKEPPAHIICLAIEPSILGICGDNYLDLEEECDDGNSINLDGCSEFCIIENFIPPLPPDEPDIEYS